MSTHWRMAGHVLGAIAFVATLLKPGHFLDVSPFVEAGIAAVSVFLAVWVYETLFLAARWVWRRSRNSN